MNRDPASEAGSFRGPGPDAVFQAHLAEGRAMIQRCDACGSHIFPPRSLCPRCGTAEPGWVGISGGGRVYSTSVERRRPEQGGPVNIALIDLDEGPRLMSRVEGVDPEAVRIGMAVTAFIGATRDGPLLLFRPAGAP